MFNSSRSNYNLLDSTFLGRFFEKIFIPVAIVFMLCLIGSKLSAQYTILYNDAASNPLPTDDVSVCQSEVFVNTARVVVSSNAADNSTITITFPPGVSYVPGCINVVDANFNVTVTELDITDLSAPIFSIAPADLSAGNQFTFEYCRIADCDATAYQMGGGIFKDELEICGDDGCVNENNPNLNSYDLSTPSLSMASDGPITAEIGDNVCRNITLTNGGLGYLDSVKYYIVDGPGTVTTSVTTPLGTVLTPIVNGDTLCYWLDAAIIAEFGDGDDFLENGEQIMLERCYDVTGCDNDSYYGAYWGCPGVCMSAGEIQQETTIPNLVPNLSFGFETGVNKDYCFKGQNAASDGTAVIQRFELCNTGDGAATNITFELHNNTPGSGTGQNYFTLEAGQVFDAAGGSLGTTSSQTGLYNGSYYQNNCDLESHPRAVEYELGGISVAPGECIYVEIPTYANNKTQECDAECNGAIAWYYFNRTYSYQDACALNNYSQARRGIAYGGRQLFRYDIAMPTDMRDCDEFDLEVNYSNFYGDTKSTTEGSTELKIDVTNTGLVYQGTGTEVYRGVNVAVTQVNDTICIVYPHSATPRGAGTLLLPLKATCATGGGTKSIRLWHEGQYDDNCEGSTYHTACLSRSYQMHCPDPCPEGGATPTYFTLERISLGLEDLNNDGVPDGTGRAKPEDVELHRASNCDTVKGTWEIFVHPNTVGPNAGNPFNHLYVEFDLNDLNLNCTYFSTDNLFEPLPDAVATIYPADGSAPYDCLVTPSIEDTPGAGVDDLAKYDLSVCKADWEGGDSIVFCALYVVNTSFHSSSFNQYVADNQVYSSYIENPTGVSPSPENKYTCDSYNDYMNVYRHYFSPWTPTPQTVNGCDGTLNYYLRSYINTQTGDIWYPREYRPFTIPDKFTIELDEAFEYRPGSVNFAGQVVPDADITQVGDVLTVCNLKQFFQGYGGPLLESDETWSYRLSLQLDPTCEAVPGLYRTRFSGQVIGNGCHSPDMNYIAVQNCSNTTGLSGYGQLNYDGPQPFLSGGGTIQFSSSTGCWDVNLNNGSNNIDAPFSWFYIDGGSNHTVLDAVGAPIAPDANGFYQLGNNPNSSTSAYTVCAASSECDTVRINVLSGYGCTSYPADIGDLSCADTVQLIGLPLMSEVQLAFETQPMVPMLLCETQGFGLKMTSAQAAYLNDPRLSMLIPNGTTISNIQVEYPCGSGNIEAASFAQSGNLIVIDIEAHSAMGTEGMPGTIDALDPTEREACITFDLDTDCDFISSSGILFQAFGKRPCGDPAINNGVRVRSQDLAVDGVNQPHGASVTIDAALPELRGCGVSNEVEVNINIVSLGSNTTSSSDSVYITLDPGVDFVPGSILCCSANSAHCVTYAYEATDAAGFTTVVLAFPATPIDITNPVNMCFTYEVANGENVVCDTEGAMNVQVRASAGDIVCTSEAGGLCENVQTLTGEKEIVFSVEKTELNYDDDAVFNCNSDGSIDYTIPITIDSLELNAGEILVVDIHCVTASGTVGAYAQSEVITGPIAAGTTVTLSGSVPAGTCNPEYGIIARLASPNFDGVDQCICDPLEIPSGALICPPDVTHDKAFTSITETGDGEYDVKWTITVTNEGVGDGNYTLNDLPGFDDDIEICGAEYTSDAIANPGNPGPLLLAVADTFKLANDQFIEGGEIHTYCLLLHVKYDPVADPAVGDGVYTACEDGTIGDPIAGEGLYNQSQLDTDDDGVADEVDEVCEDLPCALVIVSAVPGACDPSTSTYDLTVTVAYGAAPDCLINIGGQTFTIDGSGDEEFVVAGLPANGVAATSVSAFFTCEATCFDQESYDAPAACTLLTCETTQVNILCHGDATGAATVVADGGFAPYTYAWNSVPAQTSSTATGLVAGAYSVTVTDSSDSTSVCSVEITEPADLTCTTTKDSDISCNGLSDGRATVSPTGGTGAYTYEWTSGETTAIATALAAGTNTVTVTDANGCTTTCTVEIVNPPAVTCTISSSSNPTCNGTATGTITVSGTGGTGTLEYALDGGAFQLGSTFSSVSAGAHTVTVRDANGCTSTCNVTLTDPAALTCTTTEDSPVACGMDNGQATVTPVGGTAPYTYLWDNTETTPQATALSAGTHSVTVTDANDCTTSCLVVITSTSGLGCEITASEDVSCNGAADGSATVAVTGGTAPYTYAWSNAATTPSVTGLSGGTYTVIITDADDCTTTCMVTIAEATELICSIVKDNDISCNGVTDGGATVSPSGGTPGYTYLWTGGETTPTASALASGTNYVTITDAAGCTTICEIEIIEPGEIVCAIDAFTDLTCNGNSSGTITASATGGVGTLEYSINGGLFQLSGNFTGLSAGTHTVTVRDENGCISNCSQALSEPLALSCVAVAEEPTACGLDIGQATVTPTGGTAGFTYLWDNLETTPTATSLSAGTHTVTVTDANDCTTTCLVVIESTSGLSCEIIESTDVTCNGEADGSATVEATGGTAPYTYAWSNGDDTATATGLTGGTYTVTITDGTNCTTTCSVTIAEATDLLCGALKNSDVSCFGRSDGSAGVEASGGTPGYTYLWTSGATNSVANNLAAGTNYVTVTDADGCTTICSVEILQPQLLECNIEDFTNLSCFESNDGAVTVSATGGVSPIEFSIDGGPFQASGVFTGLDATIHTITVRDANGCTTDCLQPLSQPQGISCEAFEDTPTSCGEDNGQASVLASGGIPAYTYLWDNLETTATAVALSAGVHSVTVTDANGCSTSCQILVTSTSGIACEIVSSTDVSCNGAADGTAEVVATGGNAPYQYAWSNGMTTAAATGLAGGIYDVVVTDADGCMTECSVTIAEATPLTCTIVKDSDISCTGAIDGGATVSASGGTPGYTYEWTSGETTVSATALGAGVNYVTITDADGCTTICEVEIIEPTLVSCSIINFSNLLCNDDASGTIQVSGTGGTGTLEYSIDGGPYQSGGNFIGLDAGAHTVTVRDAEGCTSTCSQELAEPAVLTCTAVADSQTACMMASGSATVTPEGGTAGYTYLWDNLETTATAVSLNAGTHTVIVTDANNCTTSCQVVIGSTSGLTCEIISSNDVSCAGAEDGAAEVSVIGGSEPYTFVWSEGTTTPAVLGLSGGTYTVIITDADGCTTDCSVTIAEATPLTCTVVKDSDISCNGSVDGGATVSASGGTPGYTYEWTSGETTVTATALGAGVNYVTITDADACTTICEVEIIEPTAVACSIVDFSDLLCNDDASGTIEVSGTGGTGALEFSIDGGPYQLGGNFTGLDAGVHTVTVRDAEGCTSTCSQALAEPAVLTCTAVADSETACMMSSGSATVTPAGGTAGYTYLWDNLETTATAVALNAGTHTVVVTDANNCTTSCQVVIVSTSGLTCEIISSNNVSCANAEDGAAEVSVVGGSMPYTYAWSDGTTTAAVSGLSGGTYTVVITDADGCTTDCSVTITEATELLCNISDVVDISCFGESDGAATVEASGGVPGYTYAWPSGEISATAVGLAAGVNTVTITDSEGCTTTCDVTIVMPELLTCSLASTPSGCQGQDDGTVTTTVNGGVAPFMYSINGGTNQTGAIFNNLPVGTYTVVVTDANGCTSECEIEVAVTGCEYDLSLIKKLAPGETGVYNPGDDVPFVITVCNQGQIPAEFFEVTDYIPTGMAFNAVNAVNVANGWASATGTSIATTVSVAGGQLPAGGLTAGQCYDLEVVMTVDLNAPQGTSITNHAEISDDDGDDTDSTADNDDTNDGPPTDDETGGANGDEDDHDPAVIEINFFDLALTKTLATGQPAIIAPSDDVTFTITVYNQGTIAADNIEITDYIPSCMTNVDPLWAGPASGPVVRTLSVANGDLPAGGLAPNDFTQVDITLQVVNSANSACDFTNYAEISDDSDANGNPIDDTDSTTDSDDSNDTVGGDDEIGGANGDEDDHDPASVSLLEFDLALSKDLAPGQASAVAPGDLVTYSITIINQGQYATDSIEVTDYIPACMTLADTDWTASGTNATYLMTVADGDLPAGGLPINTMASVEITLLLDNPVDATCDLTNWAEISSDQGDDVDSTPDGDDSNDPPSEDDIDNVPIDLLNFDLALSKDLATGQASAVAPGDDITFTISVVNQGNITADNIEITDYLPSCTSLNDADWTDLGTTATYVMTAANGDLPAGGLAPNGVASVDITLVLDNPLDATCDMTNWAEISDATDEDGMPQVDEDSSPDNDPSNDPPGEDDIDDEPFEVLEFDLALTKSLATGQTNQVMPGDDVTFTFTIFNQGQIPADNIEITDFIPADFALNDPNWVGPSPAVTTLSVLGGDLPAGGLLPGQSTTVDITLNVQMTAVNGQTYVNYGEISDATDEGGDPQVDIDSDPDQDPNNDPAGEDDIDNEPLTIMGMCDLSQIKTVNRFESNGDGTGGQITFDITVTNQGGCDAYYVGLVDYIIPTQDMVLNDSDWFLSPFSGFAYYTIEGPILPGQSETVEITFDITSFDPNAPQVNWSEITGSEDFNGDPQEDEDSDPDQDPINDGPPINDEENNASNDEDDHDFEPLEIMDLAIDKSLDAAMTPPYAYGDDITFNICVTNEGNQTASSVVIADHIPAGFVYDPLLNPGWTGAAPTVNYTIAGPVAPGDEVCVDIILEFVSTGTSTGDYTNVTEITEVYDEDGNPENDDWDSTPNNDDGDQSEDDEDNEVFEVFDLELDKTIVTQGPYSYGQDVVFEMQICNTGSVVAQNIVVEDRFPCGYEFISSAGWTENGGTVATTIAGPLNPSDCETVSLTLRVQACSAADAYLNVSEITDSEDGDGNPRDDIDSEEDNDIPAEDDQDDELIEIYDLALQKVIDDRGPYLPGDVVEFKFNIHNQGNVDASNIVITDYLNTGFIFTPGGANAGWTSVGDYAEYTYAGPIAPGDVATVSIFLEITIPAGADIDSWINEGEISDDDGVDADSSADDNPDNDNDVTPGDDNDDEISEHAGGDDEDDNDVADVLVTGEIGDTVWKDLDGNGIQDAGEPGVANVIVTLYDCNGAFVRRDTTDASGYYLFDLLLPGGYQLNFDISELAPGCAFTFPGQGGESEDSDADLNGNTTCITLEAGENNHDIDVGLLRLTCIGDLAWHDLDGNGVQDAGEPGLPGVGVNLYRADGTIVSSTITDGNGNFLFDNLYPGDYYLQFNPTSQYPLITDANQGSNTELDSDVDHSNGNNTTPVTTLGADGNCDLSWDAGFYNCVPIGELVWYDLNRNNVVDVDENGINGLEIELYRRVNGTWSLWDSEFTGYKPGTASNDGYFKFCAPPGQYYLKAILPTNGLVAVDANVGNDDTRDSDFDGSNGPNTSETFNVVCGGEKCDLAAGFYTMSSVGSLVWQDDNADGLRQSNEAPVAGVKIEAYDIYNDLVGTAISDEEGRYTIDHLRPEGYYLKVTPPKGLDITNPNIGVDDSNDSDVDHSNGKNTTDYIMMVPGAHLEHVDVGLIARAVAPFEITDFNAKYRPDMVALNWKTVSEEDISYYQVERRHESKEEYNAMGKILSGQGDKGYDISDYDIEEEGVYYYRLISVDSEGSQQISDEIAINVSSYRTDGISIYPNPAVSDVNLELSLSVSKLVTVDIYNTQGTLVKAAVIKQKMAQGVTNTRIDVSDIPSGVYNLKISMGEQTVTKRLILLNN